MLVTKRRGVKEPVKFDKIAERIRRMSNYLFELKNINSDELAQKVIQGVTNGIETRQIDIYTADLASSMGITHLEYLILAGRIVINNHHKNTKNSFADKMVMLYLNKDKNDVSHSIIGTRFYKYIMANQAAIDKHIDYSRDYLLGYFGFKTLEKGYLLRCKGHVIERPQDMFMRVAVQLYMPYDESSFTDEPTLQKIFEVYDEISNHYYTQATPTLFNSGTPNPQASSCFLLGTEDSLEGIMKTLTDAGKISKWSGGVGIHISNWRGARSLIRGTNGKSSGLIPMLRMFNECARAFNQGGKRNGSFAIYLEPHHPDILAFLDMKRPHGDESLRCRDLFSALWISDLFMKRMMNNSMWSLFDPDECPGLNETWGEEYEKLYLQYESEGRARETIPINIIVNAIFNSQTESGSPYILYKDAVNRSNMQSNIGIIKSSNLCTEIMLHSNSHEYAVCNLASICLSKLVEDTYTKAELELPSNEVRKLNNEFPKHPVFNIRKLVEIAGKTTENVNQVIDRTWNPVKETARSNFMHRPIGIGIQGLADTFMKLKFPFESPEARKLNKQIAEAIYYGALSKSTILSKRIYKDIIKRVRNGETVVFELYPKHIREQFPELEAENVKYTFTAVEEVPKDIGAYFSYNWNGGAPIKKHFHWELCGLKKEDLSGMFDWDTLRDHINEYGVRNSTLVAYMPTASTSRIMGNEPSFEPFNTNIYKKKSLAGHFTIINKYLMNDLFEAGLWDENMKRYLLQAEGSIQNINGIPEKFKNLYKTVWEIKQKVLMQMAADRQPFVDQAQSLNLFVRKFADRDDCASIMLMGWKLGLKTCSYYLHVRPAIEAQKFTIAPDLTKKVTTQEILNAMMNTNHDDEEKEEICTLCSS